MQYTILRLNDNNTATVEMKASNGHILNQDFALGSSTDDLETAIKQGLAVLESEVSRKQDTEPSIDLIAYERLVDKQVAITEASLPIIPAEDLQIEQPEIIQE